MGGDTGELPLPLPLSFPPLVISLSSDFLEVGEERSSGSPALDPGGFTSIRNGLTRLKGLCSEAIRCCSCELRIRASRLEDTDDMGKWPPETEVCRERGSWLGGMPSLFMLLLVELTEEGLELSFSSPSLLSSLSSRSPMSGLWDSLPLKPGPNPGNPGGKSPDPWSRSGPRPGKE